jgi:hypothetical protein
MFGLKNLLAEVGTNKNLIKNKATAELKCGWN